MNRIVVLLTMACTVSPSVAQKVRIDFDHGCHFSKYKTYRWVQAQDGPFPDAQLQEPLFPNQLMQERIVGFVEEALAARRLTRVQTGGDLLVGCRMTVTEEQQYQTIGDGWGWGWGGGVSITTPITTLVGTLTVDLLDSHQKRLVFQGVSTETVSSRPNKNTRRLARGVNKIFAKYPPQR